jgi:nucleotide-binding universal stress UspA family protein
MAPQPDAPRLVVGVDGEGHADPAVRAAFALARAVQGDVELVHVPQVPHPLWQHVSAEALAKARAQTVDRLAAALSDLAVGREELDQRLVVEQGSPAKVLHERAEGAAWILLGGHQREGALDFGDNVRAVLSRAGVPVWVQPGPFSGVRRVLAAVDLSEPSRRVLTRARDLALAFGAELEVLHVFVRPDLGYVLGYAVPFPASVVEQARETAEDELARLARAIDGSGLEPQVRFVDGDPVSEILAAQERCEVLVLAGHAHGRLFGPLLGSTTRRVLGEASRAVVVLGAD